MILERLNITITFLCEIRIVVTRGVNARLFVVGLCNFRLPAVRFDSKTQPIE